MKILIYLLIAIGSALIIYNFTFIDFQNIFSGDSATALVGVLASSCVVVLMIILLISRSIAEKVKK